MKENDDDIDWGDSKDWRQQPRQSDPYHQMTCIIVYAALFCLVWVLFLSWIN